MDRRKSIKNIGLGLGYATIGPTILSALASCNGKTIVDSNFFKKDDLAILNKVVDIILPQGKLPGGLDVGIPSFIDIIASEVMTNEEQGKYYDGFIEFKNELEVHKQNNKVTKLEERIILFLDKYLKTKVEYPLSKEEELSHYFITKTRDIAIWGYKSSEEIGKKVMAYNPLPGVYQGCEDLHSLTNGKAWTE